MIRMLPIAALLLALPASAAERNYSVASFDRLRVNGPFRVVLTTGKSPSAKAEGEPSVTDALDIRVEGDTLMIRAGLGGWGEQPRKRDGGPLVIRVSTGMIRSATMLGGGDVTIVGALRGQRIDLTLTGGGTLNAGAIDADQFTATLTGSGRMTLGGRAARARLASNGPATFAAAALEVNDLSVVTEGNGDLAVQARYTAAIASNGLGSVTVYGNAACTVRGVPAGPVSCGKLPPPAPTAP